MTETEWVEIFRTNLIEMMSEYGYTQRDLAEATGLSEMAISNYVNGRRIPTVRSIINISYEFNIDVNDLIDFGDRIEG